MSSQVVQGPGSLRVGRFIGRLGVVSIPAVQAGLDLDQRVVRRHVRLLETAEWLARASWVWGEGSVVWLTAAGLERAGLGGVRAVKSPPAPTTIAHGVLVGWSAARAEHRGHVRKSARELALDADRWAVPARCERGYTLQLPDVAVWPDGWESPGAVTATKGARAHALLADHAIKAEDANVIRRCSRGPVVGGSLVVASGSSPLGYKPWKQTRREFVGRGCLSVAVVSPMEQTLLLSRQSLQLEPAAS